MIQLSSPEETTEEEIEIPKRDDIREDLISKLKDDLGESLVATEIIAEVDVWARVTKEAWLETAQILLTRYNMKYFNFLSAIDWLPSPFGRDMDAQVDQPEPVTPEEMTWGTTGGETRFQLLARVHDPENHLGISLKVDLEDTDLSIESWSSIYPGADWHEREVSEMFGITFLNHPNPVKLYLPGDFEGYPMRKDFALLARRIKPWPGIVDVEDMPGEESEEDEVDA